MSRNAVVLLLVLLASYRARAGDGEAVLQKIVVQEARLSAVEKLIADAKAAGVPVAYPTADFLIAKRFCQYGRDDVLNDRIPRAQEVAGEVAALLDRAEREARDGVEVPRIIPGSVRITDGAFQANCTIGAKEGYRPVFFTGYGHGEPVIEDLPLLGEIGINVIQIEQGPEGVVNADGTVNTAPITDRLLPALNRARDHGAMVNLLVSPHYFPAWAYEKWPALKVEPGAPGTQPFLKNSIEAPEAREIYSRFLRTLIPLVKDHPALHSICLSNEPIYDKHQSDPARVPFWHQYIEATHRDIGTPKALYETSHAAFGQVPETPLGFHEKPAALYDVVRFNQIRFSGWHRWMVDIIHEMAPNLECHAKAMPLVWDRDSVLWGTDPLEFSRLGRINGNDCYFVPNDAGSPWPSDWLIQGMFYDLQRSMARNPITVRLPGGEWQDLIARQPLPLDITLQPNTPVLAQGATRSTAESGSAPGLDILPGAVPDPPSYQALSQGPLKVRLFPGQATPCLQHYINLNVGSSSSNYIAALQRDGLSGSWAMMSLLSSDGLQQYIETDRPICCYFTITPVQNHQLESNAPMLAAMDYVEKNHKGFYTYGVCEWENTFFRHWEQETDTTVIYGATPAELSRMDRKGNYEILERTAQRWKKSVRDRMVMANGYGMLSHLADIGLDAIGIETSETIPATQVKRAFARGAARQFEIPWFEEVSVWFGASVSGGMPKSEMLSYWPNTPVGGEAGHSASHLMRHWFTSWFSGANHVMLEASPQVLFEVPWSNEFPENPKLSPYGREAQRLAALMNSLDIGVPYTPFAILMNKYHGRWSVWGKPWGRLQETSGDKMTERFFDQLFPGQSQGPGNEERYLCSSPYGDTFDVLINNAARSSWQAYPVILVVGDIPWTVDEIQFLKEYVRDGGILAMNEIHIDGWDRAWLGLASEGFAPTADAQAVLKSSDGDARLIRRDIGQGCVLVSSRKPEPDLDQEMAFPNELLVCLAEQYLPFRIEGDVQTLINRTKDGWALMIVNNKGITKELHVDQRPVIDASATQRVGISFQGQLANVSELIYDDKMRIESTGAGNEQRIRFDLPPGEIRLIKIDE